MEQIFNILQNTTVSAILNGLLILLVGFVAIHYVSKVTDNLLEKIKLIDPLLRPFVKSAIMAILDLIVILMTASALGIPITSVLALFSVVGLAISLAVQSLLTTLVSGMVIMAGKLLHHGDYIVSGDIAGTVLDIGFLYTRMKTADGRQIIVPNNVLTASTITNANANGTRRIDIDISASYDNSPDEVRTAMLDAVSRVPNLLSVPAPELWLEEYADSAIRYSIHVWTNSSTFLTAKYALQEQLYHSFKANGVELTYPHLNVHMDAN